MPQRRETSPLEISAGYLSVMVAVVINTIVVAYLGGRITQKVETHERKHEDHDKNYLRMDERVRHVENVASLLARETHN